MPEFFRDFEQGGDFKFEIGSALDQEALTRAMRGARLSALPILADVSQITRIQKATRVAGTAMCSSFPKHAFGSAAQ